MSDLMFVFLWVVMMFSIAVTAKKMEEYNKRQIIKRYSVLMIVAATLVCVAGAASRWN